MKQMMRMMERIRKAMPKDIPKTAVLEREEENILRRFFGFCLIQSHRIRSSYKSSLNINHYENSLVVSGSCNNGQVIGSSLRNKSFQMIASWLLWTAARC